MEATVQSYREIFNTLAKAYLVPDIVPEETKFLFILESPHVEELKHGAPVSGASGASMTRHLFGTEFERFPLGRIVKKNADENLRRPSICMIALMNVCQIPMQKAAYNNPQLIQRHSDFFQALEGVRGASNRMTYGDPNWNVVQEIIVHSLQRKLRQLTQKRLYVIPCGRFAQKFFRLADVTSSNWEMIDDIPHPSYNNWGKPGYATAVSTLVQSFSRERSAL